MKNNNATPIEVIDYLCAYYDQFGNLPVPVIECQISGVSYTAFGTNLKNKIEKAGGIKELLTTFQGRGVAKKEKKVQVKATETENVSATITKRVRPSRSKAAIAARMAEKATAEVQITA